MKPARQLDVSTATDLILRLVPVFQIPVPQDHLKHKEQTANFQLNATFVCVYTCRNSIFTWKEHRFCLCSASGFSPRAPTGQTLAANRSSMPLSGYTL